MSISDFQFESHTPRNALDNQLLSGEEKIFEQKFEMPPHRPLSAKNEEKMPFNSPKRKTVRPLSAKKKTFPIRQRIKFRGEGDKSFLARLKPRNIYQDKERLYEENLALKLQINKLNDELVKLRTKATQLEKEISKKNDLLDKLRNNTEAISSKGFKKIHLITSLRQSVKELRTEIKLRDEEIMNLRKNIKCTNREEMEIEEPMIKINKQAVYWRKK